MPTLLAASYYSTDDNHIVKNTMAFPWWRTCRAWVWRRRRNHEGCSDRRGLWFASRLLSREGPKVCWSGLCCERKFGARVRVANVLWMAGVGYYGVGRLQRHVRDVINATIAMLVDIRLLCSF